MKTEFISMFVALSFGERILGISEKLICKLLPVFGIIFVCCSYQPSPFDAENRNGEKSTGIFFGIKIEMLFEVYVARANEEL